MVRFAWRAYPSAVTTGVNDIPRTVVDPTESLGHPGVAKATEINATNTAFAYLKGMASILSGVPDGTGQGIVNVRPPEFNDLLLTIGERGDPRATDASSATLISLLKGIAGHFGAEPP
jgi:hypothetical protein